MFLGFGAAPPQFQELSTGERFKQAGLSFFERVAAGEPAFTVGARAEIGPYAALAALAPAMLMLAGAYILFRPRR